MNMNCRILIPLLALALVCDPARAQQTPQASTIPDLPATLKARQRSVTAVPGTNGKLQLSTDDITRGQVMASLSEKDGRAVLLTRSFTQGQSAKFTFGGTEYCLTLDSLENALIGEDFATFAFVQPAKVGALTEAQKVEGLLARLASLKDVVFVRDAVEYVLADEVKTLRKQWDAMNTPQATAAQFLEKVAPKTNRDKPDAYAIRFTTVRLVPVRTFLDEELAHLEEK